LTDPHIQRIIRDAEQEIGGQVIAFLILLAALGVFGVALYIAAGGRLA